ncbi:MAG: hypothetical protein QM734_03140 [Cyclobacteriaceae bacterium]
MVYRPFQVLGDDNQPYSFSGFTAAKMTIRNNETSNEIISFSNTGTSYQIDISDKDDGYFILKCNSFQIPSGGYLFDFEVSNATQKQYVMGGKIIVKQNITQ